MKKIMLLTAYLIATVGLPATAQLALPPAYGQRFFLTPPGQDKSAAAANTVAAADFRAQVLLGRIGNTVSAAAGWAGNYALALYDFYHGLWDGITINAPQQSSPDNGYAIGGCNGTITTPGCFGAAPNQVDCYKGTFYQGCSPGVNYRWYCNLLRYPGVGNPTPDCTAVAGDPVSQGGPILGAVVGSDDRTFFNQSGPCIGMVTWQCHYENAWTYNLARSGAGTKWSQTPPTGPEIPNTVAAYQNIVAALASGSSYADNPGQSAGGSGSGPDASSVNPKLTNSDYTLLTSAKAILENGVQLSAPDVTVVSSATASTPPTTSSPESPAHVIVDNTVTVKYQGDDGTLPAVTDPGPRSRHKTFAQTWTDLQSQRPPIPILDFLNSFSVGADSSTTMSTQFCFTTAHFGQFCFDLANSGFWTAIMIGKFAVLGTAFFASYYIIFG